MLVGDVMLEVVRRYADRVATPAEWNDWSIHPGGFLLATIHRAENTDDRSRLRAIVGGLAELAMTLPVIFPIHPRTRALLPALGIALPESMRVVAPLRYGEMLAAQQAAAVVVTDSGGVQKEAYWLGVPCVTARDETEWPETLADQRNVLVGADRARLVAETFRQAARSRLTKPEVEHTRASHEIVARLGEYCR
jgi:UDP-N-acetylglucosamine 2-epimerase